ncbi:MAG TPA: hypothetical protein VJN18_22885 [Polyangiaceae bacterium]|nr:hypothetical protein [Polyangiaceae bacterium]
MHYLATNDGELGRLVPLNDGTGPRGALKRLANQSWVDSHLTEVESASPKGSGPVAGWGKGPAVRREVAVARKSRAARGELLKYRLRHPKSFLVTHAGRDGARAPRGLLAFCECLGLGHVKDGDELFELRIDLRPGLKFKYWRPTIFDVLRTRDAYDCFPDWLARQDPTTKAPCGLTRHLKTGRPCLPELIVDLEDGAELEVIPRGTLKQTPGRAYLRLDPDP